MIALAPDDVRRLAADGTGASLVIDFVGCLRLIDGTVSGPAWGALHDRYELSVLAWRPWKPRRERLPGPRRCKAVVTGTDTGTEDIDGRR